MKDRPILFNAEMVRAVLDGRKTVTRRVVKPQPEYHAHDGTLAFADTHSHPFYNGKRGIKCPYGSPGDRLWVRETWGYRGAVWSSRGSQEAHVTYHADGSKESVPFENPGDLQESTPKQNIKYPPNFDSLEEWERRSVEGQLLSDWWKRQQKKPSIHMPRWASRILLEVVSVRVERVLDITNEGAYAEGISMPPVYVEGGPESPRCAFAYLWQAIYGTWADNPWTWVVEFKRVEG